MCNDDSHTYVLKGLIEMTKTIIEEKILEIFETKCQKEVTLNQEIDSLGVDSIEVIELIVEMEDAFNVTFDDEYMMGHALKIMDYYLYICNTCEVYE